MFLRWSFLGTEIFSVELGKRTPDVEYAEEDELSIAHDMGGQFELDHQPLDPNDRYPSWDDRKKLGFNRE